MVGLVVSDNFVIIDKLHEGLEVGKEDGVDYKIGNHQYAGNFKDLRLRDPREWVRLKKIELWDQYKQPGNLWNCIYDVTENKE